MNTLITLSEFVDKQANLQVLQSVGLVSEHTAMTINSIIHYNNALKQPIELKRFVPVGEDGEILDKPKGENYEGGVLDVSHLYQEKLRQFESAMKEVWFEGFESHTRDDRYTNMNWVSGKNVKSIALHGIKTYSDLTNYGLTLTEAGNKAFFK